MKTMVIVLYKVFFKYLKLAHLKYSVFIQD